MPRTVDRPDRQFQIEEAVIDLAAESGFSAVTMRAVAGRISGSTTAITHYFDSRESLLRSAVRREMNRAREQIGLRNRDLDDPAALRAFVERTVLRPNERSDRFWLALVQGAGNENVLREELDGFNAWWDQQIRSRLIQLAPLQSMDSEVLADLLDVLVDGLIVAGFDDSAPWPNQRRQRLLNAVWRLLDI